MRDDDPPRGSGNQGPETPDSTSTETSTQLLNALKSPANKTAWRDYVNRYRPVVVRFARRLGLDADQSEDAVQQTLIAFSESYREGRFDRTKGRLRGRSGRGAAKDRMGTESIGMDEHALGR